MLILRTMCWIST